MDLRLLSSLADACLPPCVSAKSSFVYRPEGSLSFLECLSLIHSQSLTTCVTQPGTHYMLIGCLGATWRPGATGGRGAWALQDHPRSCPWFPALLLQIPCRYTLEAHQGLHREEVGGKWAPKKDCDRTRLWVTYHCFDHRSSLFICISCLTSA